MNAATMLWERRTTLRGMMENICWWCSVCCLCIWCRCSRQCRAVTPFNCDDAHFACVRSPFPPAETSSYAMFSRGIDWYAVVTGDIYSLTTHDEHDATACWCDLDDATITLLYGTRADITMSATLPMIQSDWPDACSFHYLRWRDMRLTNLLQCVLACCPFRCSPAIITRDSRDILRATYTIR